MKERLLEFLRSENKSSAQLADEIGVQPSGISHILSGRNNPSLDFVLKMLERYPYLSSDWLLFGKGTIYKDATVQKLFDESINLDTDTVMNPVTKAKNGHEKAKEPESSIITGSKDEPEVEKIVWFFKNKRFREYFPGEKEQS